eukprot:CAMPEP_0174275520 /NCGR_PEP_ID=MMETSP0439-20130205/59870_1 /TAXON_ID=0 /ORGANISM="Stereomyxa ramosa, Strain Chinc5" /LENGTH=759 /DNA_ID=CAMNT_0015367631 /DNA_START=241 /DNA_END=2520 /DNA_ORIENTATION=+
MSRIAIAELLCSPENNEGEGEGLGSNFNWGGSKGEWLYDQPNNLKIHATRSNRRRNVQAVEIQQRQLVKDEETLRAQHDPRDSTKGPGRTGSNERCTTEDERKRLLAPRNSLVAMEHYSDLLGNGIHGDDVEDEEDEEEDEDDGMVIDEDGPLFAKGNDRMDLHLVVGDDDESDDEGESEGMSVVGENKKQHSFVGHSGVVSCVGGSPFGVPPPHSILQLLPQPQALPQQQQVLAQHDPRDSTKGPGRTGSNERCTTEDERKRLLAPRNSLVAMEHYSDLLGNGIHGDDVEDEEDEEEDEDDGMVIDEDGPLFAKGNDRMDLHLVVGDDDESDDEGESEGMSVVGENKKQHSFVGHSGVVSCVGGSPFGVPPPHSILQLLPQPQALPQQQQVLAEDEQEEKDYMDHIIVGGEEVLISQIKQRACVTNIPSSFTPPLSHTFWNPNNPLPNSNFPNDSAPFSGYFPYKTENPVGFYGNSSHGNEETVQGSEHDPNDNSTVRLYTFSNETPNSFQDGKESHVGNGEEGREERGKKEGEAGLGSGEGGEGTAVKRRKRTRITATQRRVLEEIFKLDPLPSSTTKKRLGVQLGIDYHKVQVWFQNKRARSKKKVQTNPPSSPPSSLSFLQQQQQQLKQLRGETQDEEDSTTDDNEPPKRVQEKKQESEEQKQQQQQQQQQQQGFAPTPSSPMMGSGLASPNSAFSSYSPFFPSNNPAAVLAPGDVGFTFHNLHYSHNGNVTLFSDGKTKTNPLIPQPQLPQSTT